MTSSDTFHAVRLAFGVMAGMLAGVASAADMDPLFRINEVRIPEKSFFWVIPPNSTQRVAVAENRAYHFGSRVEVGPESSAKIFFDPVNHCTIGPGTSLTLKYDDKNSRTLTLHAGKLDFKIDEEFRKIEKAIHVVTPVGTASAVQGKFSVAVSPGSGGSTSVVACADGKAVFKGKDFQVASLDADDALQMTTLDAGGFVRVVNANGAFAVGIRDSDGNPRDVALESKQSLKIWRRELSQERGAVITILIMSKKGTLLTTPEGALDKNAKISYKVES